MRRISESCTYKPSKCLDVSLRWSVRFGAGCRHVCLQCPLLLHIGVRLNQFESTVEGKIIRVGRDKESEAIVFEIPMGFFKIVAIANIPDEGADKAPVYIKIRPNTNFHRKDTPRANNGVPVFRRRAPQPVEVTEEEA
jgi:hypothetical protein